VPAGPRRRALRVLAALLAVVAGVAACTSGNPRPGPAGVSPTTPPPPTPTVDPAAQAAALVSRLSNEDLVGQVLMPAINLDDPADGSVNLVRTYHLGGVILMGNVPQGAQPAAHVRQLTDQLQAAARSMPVPAGLLIATDQEYGWVTRVKSGVVQLPSAMAFGAAHRPYLTEAAWRGAGGELAALGINVDFAPVADVIGPAGNTVIGSRSYGSEAPGVSEQVAAVVRGLQASGVAATVKHFPGHGQTTVNSHVALPVLAQSRASLDTVDLAPFRAGIGAGAWLVMAGHLDVRAIDPGVPASFSRKVLIDLLRGQLGFDGVIVTDALNMAPAMQWDSGEAAVRALLAGQDLLLMPPNVGAARQGILDALASGRLPRPRLVDAATRVLTLKYRLAGFARPGLAAVGAQANTDLAAQVAAAGVTVLRGPCAGPLVTGPVRITSSEGRGQQRTWLTEALRARGVTVVDTGGSVVHLVGYGDGVADLVPATVTVSMDTPYVLEKATSAVRMATYSSTRAAMEAAAAVIAGKANAAGRSPVAVGALPRTACAA